MTRADNGSQSRGKAQATSEVSMLSVVWPTSGVGRLPTPPARPPARASPTSTSSSDVTTTSASDYNIEELPVIIKEDLAAAAMMDKSANVPLPEFDAETMSSSGSSSNGKKQSHKSKSSQSSSSSGRRLRSRHEIHPAVILPVGGLQLTTVKTPQMLTPPSTVVSSASPGSNKSLPRIQNVGRLRSRGTFTTARHPSMRLQDKKKNWAPALLSDERFIRISECQLAAAAFAGDQIAETHLRQRNRKARHVGASRGSSRTGAVEHLPEIGVLSIGERESAQVYVPFQPER